VTCEYFSDGTTQTVVHHENEEPTLVDGYQEAGSFIQDIKYDADFNQIDSVVNRSESCKQFIKLDCKQARLFNSPGKICVQNLYRSIQVVENN